MALTVPFAGVDAGRAAQPRFEAPQDGAVIAQLGERLTQVGTAIEADRLDRQSQRLQVDLTKDMNDLRLKYAQMGDPDAIDTQWPKDLAALKQSYLGGTDANGRPRVDPKLAGRFAIAFDDLANRQAFAIGSNSLELRQSQRRATFIEYGDAVAAASAGASWDDIGKNLADYGTWADNEVKEGRMTPEQAATAKIAKRDEIVGGKAIQDINADPQAYLDERAAGKYADMPPEWQARSDAAAKGALAAEAEKAATAADKAAREQKAVIQKGLEDGIALAKDGRMTTAESVIDNPAVAAEFPDQVAELRGYVALRDNGHVIAGMNLKSLEALKAELSAKSYSKPYQAEMLKAVEGRIKEVREGLRTDPIGTFKEPLSVGDIDLSDPAKRDATFAERARDVKRLTDSGHLDGKTFFTPDEDAQIKDMAAVEKSPQERLDLALSLDRSIGPDAALTVTADPVLAGTAHMIASKAGTPALGLQILSGQRMIQDKALPLPSTGAWKEVFEAAGLTALFEDGTNPLRPDENGAYSQLSDMAFALYVQRKGTNATYDDGEIDEGMLKKAFFDVAGGTGTPGRTATRGGFATIRGRNTLLPPGVAPDEVDTSLNTLVSAVTWRGRGNPVTPEQASAAWAKVSRDGTVPMVAGQLVDPATFDNLHLRAMGGTDYSIVWTSDDGEDQVLTDAKGKPWVMDLDKLLATQGAAP